VVLPNEKLRELALFAGIGGGILGGKILGWRTVCAVENAPYPRRILLSRQRDGVIDRFPIWDDVKTFDGIPWRGSVDVVSGGFPCQDISVAGRGAGIRGERSGLWAEFARIIGEVQPTFVFVENSPILTSRGLSVVLGDLSQMGYDARWGVIGVGDAGGLHQRNRIWIVAYPNDREKRIQGKFTQKIYRQPGLSWCEDVRGIEDLQGRSDIPAPILCGTYHGIPSGVDRVAACGNAQHPDVVKLAWNILTSLI